MPPRPSYFSFSVFSASAPVVSSFQLPFSGSTNGTRFSQALAGGRVGFGLGGALGREAQRFFDRVGERFFDVSQVFFRALVNGLEAVSCPLIRVRALALAAAGAVLWS